MGVSFAGAPGRDGKFSGYKYFQARVRTAQGVENSNGSGRRWLRDCAWTPMKGRLTQDLRGEFVDRWIVVLFATDLAVVLG